MNDLNAVLHGGPYDGLDVHCHQPHLVVPQIGPTGTITGWHTYRALNPEHTDYEHTGYRPKK